GISCYMIYLIAKRIFDQKTALISAGIYALYPHAIRYAGHLNTEPMFTLLLLISIHYLTVLIYWRSYKYAALTGLFLGLATLTRVTTQAFPLFILGILLLRKPWQSLKLFIVLVLVMSFVISPWTMRNYAITGKIIPVRLATDTIYTEADTTGSEVQEDSLIAADTAQYISNLVSLLSFRGISVVLDHGTKFWYWGQSRITNYASIMVQSLLIIPAVIGIGFSVKKKKKVSALLLIILYFWVLHSVFWGGRVRYAVPIMPYVIMFAAYAVRNYCCIRKHYYTRKNIACRG
ncbi:MAG: glycosyltransferase family 39 protein, partial [archaeon]